MVRFMEVHKENCLNPLMQKMATVFARLCRKVEVIIISTSNSRDIIGARMKMLGISRYYAGPQDKLEVLQSWMQELDIEKESIAFIGDDLNDRTIMEYVEMVACPQDAVEEIKLLVDVVLSKKGGEGCVREFIDRFILSTEY